MKKSELKEMIRQSMLGEEMDVPMNRSNFYARTMVKANLRDLGVDLKDPMSTNNVIYSDGVDDVAAMLRDDRGMEAEQHAKAVADQIYNQISLEEAEGEEEEAEEVEAEEEEISVEDELEDEVEAAPEVSGDTAEVQDHLEAALEVAVAMGDEKLATQIKNTQIYLTRSQTVSEEEEGGGNIIVNISNIRLQQLISALKQSTELAEDLMDDERYDFEGLSMQLDTFIGDLSNLSESLASKIQRAHASEKEEEEKKEVSEEDLYENKRMLKIAGIIK